MFNLFRKNYCSYIKLTSFKLSETLLNLTDFIEIQHGIKL